MLQLCSQICRGITFSCRNRQHSIVHLHSGDGCGFQVTRSALMNACGIAGIMLTTQAVMVEKKDPKSAGNAQAAMGGMGAGGMPAGMTM